MQGTQAPHDEQGDGAQQGILRKMADFAQRRQGQAAQLRLLKKGKEAADQPRHFVAYGRGLLRREQGISPNKHQHDGKRRKQDPILLFCHAYFCLRFFLFCRKLSGPRFFLGASPV